MGKKKKFVGSNQVPVLLPISYNQFMYHWIFVVLKCSKQ